MSKEHLLPHIDLIAKRLKEVRAVAVVGAGFSKNAVTRASASAVKPKSQIEMPDWQQLVHELASQLHPGDELAIQRMLNRGMLHVAQLYEANQGRPQLNQLIKNSVPDGLFEPGDLHHRLLELPWSDILTFNYDTLLERAANARRYGQFSTVYQTGDILTSPKPRIIKLHGSLPMGPFVISEEDFRTFAQDYPAFVNTVRQLMIENVLVLFGFSGDDPNFRQMHGWVRDLFKQGSNQVYLCHVGEMDAFEAKLFEKTYSITPLNLAEFVNDPNPATHSGSLSQFFVDLKRAVDKGQSLQSTLGIIEWPKETNFAFYAPTFARVHYKDREFPVEDLVNEWNKQRSSYPGWLVAPLEARESISKSTEHWPDFIRNGALNAEILKVIRVMYEMVWRWDVSLTVFQRDWVEWIEAVALQAMGIESPSMATAKQLSLLLLSCVRNHREDLDEEKFQSMLKKTASMRRADPELDANLLHEECLMAFQSLDFERVESLITRWDALSSEQIIHQFRHVGWLAETGQYEKARQLVCALLAAINEDPRKADPNIAFSSAEGWVLYYHRMILSLGINGTGSEPPEHQTRLKELRPVECDPWERIKELSNNLRHPKSSKQNSKERPTFDPGTVTRTVSYVSCSTDGGSHAFQYMRLFDHLGMPHHPGNLAVAGGAMSVAAREVLPLAFRWSCAVRIRNADKTLLDETLSREFVLRLRDDDASWLVQVSLRSLAQVISRLPNEERPAYDHYAGKNLPFFMRLASMLTLRMSLGELETLFEVVCAYRSHVGFQAAFMMWDAWSDALKRTLFAASISQLERWLPLLAAMPLPPSTRHDETILPLSLEPFASAERAKVLDHGIDLNVDPVHVDAWLVALKSGSPALRCAAFKRLLAYLRGKNWIDESVTAFEDALWSVVDRHGLPNSTGYYELTFLNFPPLTSERTRELMKCRFMQSGIPSLYRENPDDKSVTISADAAKHYFTNLADGTARAWSDLKINLAERKKVIWQPDEAAHLLDDASGWWDGQRGFLSKQSKKDDPFWQLSDVSDLYQECLAYAVIPHLNNGERVSPLQSDLIYRIADEMKSLGFDASLLQVALCFVGAKADERFPSFFQDGLLSNSPGEVETCANALLLWLTWAAWKECELDSARTAITMITDRVRYRMSCALPVIMRVCHCLLRDHANVILPSHVQAIDDGLALLLEETLISPTPEGEIYTEDLSLNVGLCELRQAAASLAFDVVAFCNKTLGYKSTAAEKWMVAAKNDRLPEVRRVLWSHAVSDE